MNNTQFLFLPSVFFFLVFLLLIVVKHVIAGWKAHCIGSSKEKTELMRALIITFYHFTETQLCIPKKSLSLFFTRNNLVFQQSSWN